MIKKILSVALVCLMLGSTFMLGAAAVDWKDIVKDIFGGMDLPVDKVVSFIKSIVDGRDTDDVDPFLLAVQVLQRMGYNVNDLTDEQIARVLDMIYWVYEDDLGVEWIVNCIKMEENLIDAQRHVVAGESVAIYSRLAKYYENWLYDHCGPGITDPNVKPSISIVFPTKKPTTTKKQDDKTTKPDNGTGTVAPDTTKKPAEDDVENPKTGVASLAAFGALTALATGAAVVSHKKKED